MTLGQSCTISRSLGSRVVVSEAWPWDAAFHGAFDGQTPDEMYFGHGAISPRGWQRVESGLTWRTSTCGLMLPID